MTRARAVFTLWLALAAAGLGITLAALALVVSRVDFAVPAVAELAAACRRWLVPHADPASLAVLGVGALSAAALIIAVHAAARQVRATRRLERAARVVGRVPTAPDVRLVESDTPEAFCTGFLRPRIYFSTGAVDLLAERELEAVVAHERHHARRRDPLRLLLARSVSQGLFFVPGLGQLAERYAALAEVDADAAAQRAPGGGRALAAALLVFDAQPTSAGVGISPQRADHLLGARVRWELPLLLLAGAGLVLTAAAVGAVRIAQATDHAAVSLPALLAQACMVAMAAVPVGLAAGGLLGGRHFLTRRRHTSWPSRAAHSSR